MFLDQRDKFVNENILFFSLDETSFGRQGRQIMGYSIGKNSVHSTNNKKTPISK